MCDLAPLHLARSHGNNDLAAKKVSALKDLNAGVNTNMDLFVRSLLRVGASTGLLILNEIYSLPTVLAFLKASKSALLADDSSRKLPRVLSSPSTATLKEALAFFDDEPDFFLCYIHFIDARGRNNDVTIDTPLIENAWKTHASKTSKQNEPLSAATLGEYLVLHDAPQPNAKKTSAPMPSVAAPPVMPSVVRLPTIHERAKKHKRAPTPPPQHFVPIDLTEPDPEPQMQEDPLPERKEDSHTEQEHEEEEEHEEPQKPTHNDSSRQKGSLRLRPVELQQDVPWFESYVQKKNGAFRCHAGTTSGKRCTFAVNKDFKLIGVCKTHAKKLSL